jgi:YD repeat-containing protein
VWGRAAAAAPLAVGGMLRRFAYDANSNLLSVTDGRRQRDAMTTRGPIDVAVLAGPLTM